MKLLRYFTPITPTTKKKIFLPINYDGNDKNLTEKKVDHILKSTKKKYLENVYILVNNLFIIILPFYKTFHQVEILKVQTVRNRVQRRKSNLNTGK